MKTKADIIQKLLDERKITVQEAMLLIETEKEYISVPTTTPNPQPYHVPVTIPGLPLTNPIWYGTTTTSCTATSNPKVTSKENHEPLFGC